MFVREREGERRGSTQEEEECLCVRERGRGGAAHRQRKNVCAL